MSNTFILKITWQYAFCLCWISRYEQEKTCRCLCCLQYELVSSCLLFPYSFPFFYYCSKDTLNNRNSQTFLVVFEIYSQMIRVHNNNPTKHHLWKCVWWNCKKQKSRPGSLCKWEAWWKLSPQRYVYFFETAKLLRINLCKILVFYRRLHITCVSFVLLQSITSEGLVLQQIEFFVDSPVELQTITLPIT